MLLYTPSTPSHDTKHGILVLAYKTHPQVIAHFLFRWWSKDGVCGYYTASSTTVTTPSRVPTMFMPSAQVGKRREGNNGTGLARSSILWRNSLCPIRNHAPRVVGARDVFESSNRRPPCTRDAGDIAVGNLAWTRMAAKTVTGTALVAPSVTQGWILFSSGLHVVFITGAGE